MTYVNKETKEKLIAENKYILDYIYYLGHGYMLHKQLLTILDTAFNFSTTTIQTNINNLIKAGILKKKQVLNSKNNILVMNATALATYEKKSTRDITQVEPSNKSILNNILEIESFIVAYLPAISKKYTNTDLDIMTVKKILNNTLSTITFTKKNILDYYKIMYNKYEDVLSTDFADDVRCLRAEKIILKNNMSKYNNIKINDEDMQTKKDIDYLKSTMTEKQRQQSFFNFSNLVNTSMDVEFIKKDGNFLLVKLAIYDNDNLNVERISTLTAIVYQTFSRYLEYPNRVKLYTNVYCLDKQTANELKEFGHQRAENMYGYRENIRQIEYMLNQGVRFPFVNEDIEIHYIDTKIRDHYNIK